MGYPELIRALEEETERQVRELEAQAVCDAEAILAAARADCASRRAAALADEERRRSAVAARARAHARLDEERALLLCTRELLAELRAEAEARLDALVDEPLVLRLLAELAPELRGAGWELRVDAPHVEAARRWCAERGLRTPVVAAPVGGAVAERAGAERLDNTLRSRLAQAWPDLEPELAHILCEKEHVGA